MLFHITKSSRRRKFLQSSGLIVASAAFAGANKFSYAADKKPRGFVVEIVTFKLKEGIAISEFKPVNSLVGHQHVAKQPGFISRESCIGPDGDWLVIVHWRSIKDAEASMASFASAAAAAPFMSKIDDKSMTMRRYELLKD